MSGVQYPPSGGRTGGAGDSGYGTAPLKRARRREKGEEQTPKRPKLAPSTGANKVDV
jgi:hypothetical protein